LITHLRAAGVSLILDTRGTKVPVILHWGTDLGDLAESALATLARTLPPAVGPSSIDVPLQLSLLPGLSEGWSGRPAIGAFRTGSASVGSAATGTLQLDLTLVGFVSTDTSISLELADASSAVRVITVIELSVEGVLRVKHELFNDGDAELQLAALDTLLPVPDRAHEILDFTGLWTHERRPQRTTLNQGIWNRESRHGRPGHDDAYLMVAGTLGFGFRSGEVWATHLAWSGDKRLWAEASALGITVLGAGELLAPGEVTIAPSASYTTPWTIAVYSATGLDGLSDRLHPWIRSWSTIPSARPVILNTWEAVYFDQGINELSGLVDAAAEVGVERFVLDDGWFSGRTDDRRALGDWFVDSAKWPEGLHPLIKRVNDAGMEFGLWVEPEMVNPESELAVAHPDWMLGRSSEPTWRFQRVLDLGNPDAFDYVLGRLDALLAEYPIAYLKWDHNRDLLAGSTHHQTSALYKLVDAVRAKHPRVEIESCASGGARIDLGILERVDRVWTSDTNDPLERQQIQRYTGILVPPEYLGSHLGAATSHTTWRTSELAFRLATALFGSAGIEWDVTRASADERAIISEWTGHYRANRDLLHSGVVVRADDADPAVMTHGVVAQDGSRAIFSYASLAAPRAAIPTLLRFPGLDPERLYRVRALTVGASPRSIQDAPPAWLAEGAEEVVLSGAVLLLVGVPVPLLAPENAALFELTATDITAP